MADDHDRPGLPLASVDDRSFEDLSLEESEARARRALGLLGTSARPSSGGAVRQDSSHRLADRLGQDSPQSTAGRGGWSERAKRRPDMEDAAGGDDDGARLDALALVLGGERAERARVERVLVEAQASIVALRGRLGEVERARDAARDAARAALETLQAEARPSDSLVVPPRRGRPPKALAGPPRLTPRLAPGRPARAVQRKPRRIEAGSLPPDQPVRWWEGDDDS